MRKWWAILLVLAITAAFGLGVLNVARAGVDGPGWAGPIAASETYALTVTGWLQDEQGNPVTGGYVELSRVNEMGWPDWEIARKYLVDTHTFAFQRALAAGRYAVILDDTDIPGYTCASDDNCWHYIDLPGSASPVVVELVWTMAAVTPIPTATPYQATPTRTPTVTRTRPPTYTLTALPTQTATPAPTFTPGPCLEFQQFSLAERLSIYQTATGYIGRGVETNIDIVDDLTIIWGSHERLGAPLSWPFFVTGDDGSKIICRAFCTAIIASRPSSGEEEHCFKYGIVDWSLYETSLADFRGRSNR